MKIQSIPITKAVQIAVEDGNTVEEIVAWTKVRQVVHMKERMSVTVRSRIEQLGMELRHWESLRTPQNPAIEGFICEEDNVAIVFPK